MKFAAVGSDRPEEKLPSSSPSSFPFRLGYVTDVEGNLEYFKKFVQRSTVLDLGTADGDGDSDSDSNIKSLSLHLRDGCYFVYGGDAIDKGPGDIRLCRALVSLKRRYPDRVFLLVGNRDLNKLRFTAELSTDDVLERSIDEIPPPHWDPNAPTLRQYLEDIAGPNETVEQINTRVNRLHYLLKHTLGCPKTFEFRRQELEILQLGDSRQQHGKTITDDQVVNSFVDEADRGSLREYLDHAQVAAAIGNTLFVHGCVDASTIRFVPSRQSKFENPPSKPEAGMMCENFSDWVDELNAYLRDGLEDYERRPHWDKARTTRGGETLMALQNRPAMWGRTVVSNCYGDGGCITTHHAAAHRNNPRRLEEEETNPLVFENVSSDPCDQQVADWLLRHGVRRVVVGHKPTGDCPAVLSASYTGVEIVSADTSFSDTSAEDNRGEAVAVVEISGRDIDHNHLTLLGSFKTGESYDCQFPTLVGTNTSNVSLSLKAKGVLEEKDHVGDSMLGRRLDDGGWWVKASTSTHYQLCRGQGRRVEYKMIPTEELRFGWSS